ncbi:MAG: trypsin-like peptidase domain-containing protein [Pyrinomonadaceae bacterium]
MVSGIAVHVAASSGAKHTEVLVANYIRIGSTEECDLRIQLPAKSFASGIALEITFTDGNYRVSFFDPTLGLTLNQATLTNGALIEDGDIIKFDAADLELQFFPIAVNPALLSTTKRESIVAPFIEQATIESRATARRDDAKVFLREFTRELVREINPSTKILAFLLTITLVGGTLYLGFAAFRELQRSRRLMDAQNQQVKLLQQVIDRTNQQIGIIEESNNNVIKSLSLGANLRNLYGNGVCLISGTYVWVEVGTGRALRHPETSAVEDGSVIDSAAAAAADNTFQLTPEGKGAVAEFEVNGTGFHVGGGYVLTNRHVVQPWTADERSLALSSSVNARPRLTKLMAYFPNLEHHINLKLRKVAEQEEDLAVCSFETKDLPGNISTLPLDRDAEAVAIGKDVVMMGYASGPYRMLATLPELESRSVQERFGSSIESLLNYFARRKMINPLTTQGHITDLYSRRIVYDAATGEGGSGSPVFGPSGRVIGVNFAVFSESNASNFAVPISFAIPLLSDAGWDQPEQPSSQAAKASATDLKNPPPAPAPK